MQINGPQPTPQNEPTVGRGNFIVEKAKELANDTQKQIEMGVKFAEKTGVKTVLVTIGTIAKMGFKKGLVVGSTIIEGMIQPGHGPAVPGGFEGEPYIIYPKESPEGKRQRMMHVEPMWQADP